MFKRKRKVFHKGNELHKEQNNNTGKQSPLLLGEHIKNCILIPKKSNPKQKLITHVRLELFLVSNFFLPPPVFGQKPSKRLGLCRSLFNLQIVFKRKNSNFSLRYEKNCSKFPFSVFPAARMHHGGARPCAKPNREE